MQELRFVAVSEDGSYAVLEIPGRSGRYILPIDERLRAVALGQTSRLAQYEIEVESPLRPKEIQARIRAGETAEEIADAAGIPLERVRWFEGPVLAERAYIAQQAQAGSVRRAGDSAGPGPRLGDIVSARLNAAGTDPADGQWDSRKRGDGNWQVALTFPSGGRLHVAEWVFDPRRRHVMPDDDNAARLSLPESDLPPEPVAVPGEATVTPIASRLGAAAGMGGGGAFASGPAVSRFRPDRSVLPDRSLGVDRSLADRPAAPAASAAPAGQAQERHAAAERPPAPAGPAPSRHAQQDRPGYQDRRGSASYAEFPESAPFRSPEPAPEPPGYREEAPGYRATAEPQGQHHQETGRGYDDPAPAPGGYRAQAPAAPSASAPASGAPGTVLPAGVAATPDGPVFENAERGRSTPPRPVIFEDPEPALLDEQYEFAPVTAPPASPAQASSVTEPAALAAPEPAAARAQVPAVTATPEPAAAPEQAAAPEAAPVPAVAEAAQPAAAGEDTAAEPPATEDTRPRPSAKKSSKARRSSVPSWDEVMLGSSRQRD